MKTYELNPLVVQVLSDAEIAGVMSVLRPATEVLHAIALVKLIQKGFGKDKHFQPPRSVELHFDQNGQNAVRVYKPGALKSSDVVAYAGHEKIEVAIALAFLQVTTGKDYSHAIQSGEEKPVDSDPQKMINALVDIMAWVSSPVNNSVRNWQEHIHKKAREALPLEWREKAEEFYVPPPAKPESAPVPDDTPALVALHGIIEHCAKYRTPDDPAWTLHITEMALAALPPAKPAPVLKLFDYVTPTEGDLAGRVGYIVLDSSDEKTQRFVVIFPNDKPHKIFGNNIYGEYDREILQIPAVIPQNVISHRHRWIERNKETK